MVVLVRCSDNSCSVALKSHLHELVNAGLVSAWLRNGEWVEAKKTLARRKCAPARKADVMRSPQAVAL
jgi:hypothetical protein